MKAHLLGVVIIGLITTMPDVQKLGVTDRGNGKRWEKAINNYLAKVTNSRRLAHRG